MRPKKILVIGLDGATFDLMLPWISESRLSNIGRILNEGVYGDLTSTIPPLTGPAWSSFMTGKNPGKHGVYGLMKRKQGTYEILPINSTDRKGRDMWEILSDEGRRVVVMNVPITYPIRKVSGILISGFLTPSNAGSYAYPATILDELRRELGEYKVVIEDNRTRAERSLSTKSYEEGFLEDTIATTDLHARAALYLMNRQWDLFVVEFQGPDGLQHIFWRDMDVTHPRHDKKRAMKYGHVIRDFYCKIDDIIGQMLSRVDRQTSVILVSDHGFSQFSKFVSLNVFLMSHGYLRLKRGPKVLIKRLMFSLGITPISLFRLLENLHLGKFRQSIRKEEFRSKIRGGFISLKDVDWSRSVAYAMGGWGQIYLNLKGREPHGIVEERDAKRLAKEISGKLIEAKDPSDGKALFGLGRVYLKDEIYHGQETPSAPEIVAIPDPSYRIFADYEFGSSKVVTDAVAWSGNHAMNGIFAAAGPGIEKGARPVNPNLIDLAPTILYLLGAAIPDDIDGRVLKEIINDDVLRKYPVTTQRATSAVKGTEYAYDDKDDENLRGTLKGLGYL